jgi:hypothetical protein
MSAGLSPATSDGNGARHDYGIDFTNITRRIGCARVPATTIGDGRTAARTLKGDPAMLNTLRRDRRTRRQASFNLEALDDRLVLSAAAAGAVAGLHEHRLEFRIARHEAKLEKLEARHEANLATKEASQEAMISRLEAKATSLSPVTFNSSGMVTVPGSATSTGASGATSPSTVTPAPVTTTSGSLNPGNLVPTSPVATTPIGTGTTTTTTGSNTTSPGPLPANVSAALQSLYQEFEGSGGGSSFTPSQPSDNLLQISGTSVMVNLQMGSGGNFSTFLSQVQSDGLTVSISSATYGQVDGMLPISDLPAIAQVAASVTPMSPPIIE